MKMDLSPITSTSYSPAQPLRDTPSAQASIQSQENSSSSESVELTTNASSLRDEVLSDIQKVKEARDSIPVLDQDVIDNMSAEELRERIWEIEIWSPQNSYGSKIEDQGAAMNQAQSALNALNQIHQEEKKGALSDMSAAYEKFQKYLDKEFDVKGGDYKLVHKNGEVIFEAISPDISKETVKDINEILSDTDHKGQADVGNMLRAMAKFDELATEEANSWLDVVHHTTGHVYISEVDGIFASKETVMNGYNYLEAIEDFGSQGRR